MDGQDVDFKDEAKIEASYLEHGVAADEAEFKRKEKVLVRKLDLFVAPVLMMLMLISYLDRGNIGFAATQGMAKDIGLKGNQLNVRFHHQQFYVDAWTNCLPDRRVDLLYLLYPG
jgi:hypothetical protein